MAPLPVVELNRAVAVSRQVGPAAGPEVVDRLQQEQSLQRCHWLPAVCVDLLEKL